MQKINSLHNINLGLFSHFEQSEGFWKILIFSSKEFFFTPFNFDLFFNNLSSNSSHDFPDWQPLLQASHLLLLRIFGIFNRE